MSGRALMVVIAGIMIVSATIFVNLTKTSNEIVANADRAYLRQTGKNIAQSGVNLGLRQLADDPTWRAGLPLMDLGDGKMAVIATEVVYQGKLAVKLTGVGITEYGSSLERRDTSIAFVARGYIPAPVKAAITTNNPVQTLGTLVVDGRDHTVSGTLLAGQGTLGVWTTSTFSQGGSSKIGADAAGVDYVPAKPADVNAYASNQTWPGGYPGSPDSVLGGPAQGFPEGTLKAIALSRVGGSQYVTNPSLLTVPLRGVTYVELPSGGIWQSMDISGSGILVVHNSVRNAIMKNMNSGTFTGVMIVDDPIHIQTTITGALVGLTSSPSEGNCIGNGNGRVTYSSDAIRIAAALASTASSGSAALVLAWWE